MTTAVAKQLRGMRYRLGGRGLDGTVDCYGVTQLIARELARELPDAWRTICRQLRAGELDVATGFPPTWRRLAGAELELALRKPLDGDVWISARPHAGVAIADGGKIWTAVPDAGVIAVPPARAGIPDEVWRA